MAHKWRQVRKQLSPKAEAEIRQYVARELEQARESTDPQTLVERVDQIVRRK